MKSNPEKSASLIIVREKNLNNTVKTVVWIRNDGRHAGETPICFLPPVELSYLISKNQNIKKTQKQLSINVLTIQEILFFN